MTAQQFGAPAGTRPGRRRPTIKDVAAVAGVSRGTVSRVLNGGTNVSPSAMDAVNRAIERTGYVLNRNARSLVTQRAWSVAFVLAEPQERFFEDPNFSTLLRGCTAELGKHDIPLLLATAGTQEERGRVVRFLGSGHVDGVLLVSTHAGNPLLEELSRGDLPVVACGRPMGHERRVAYVAADDREGARDVVRYLRERGRRRVATITGPLDTPGGVQRLEGYRDVVGSDGPDLVAHGDYTQRSGEEAMRQLLERAPDLDAVFVASDLMALGALTALRRAGRRVPEDVAVAGFDDAPIAVGAEPPLTTVRQPMERISAELVRLLMARIAGEEPSAVILPTELVVRRSA
ncbi:LacI family DNA-binding transcriptional regulator [Allostreptomyces psammosilenae]|uniref:DNA-binding LacI/PurR family transcriptional regulator n=1 Tax=Allostreptomyces psammosilenae TaxID=1892865 RepID=A0A853A8E1_9ACTN|nr:LacI family DNA-binding transcriptional regulator [Allostreptomyces psammosilenae]NYI06911.1 DNA-binding LacI/PurR family transcriptional regulator [Allostreptomyces psammosilenae]